MGPHSVGILGLGAYLPPDVRTNDHWPAHVVASWAPPPRDRAREPASQPTDETPGGAAVRRAMDALAGDPFQGSKQRHVMSPGMLASEMEIAAARDALARADVDASEIDAVIGFSFVPDLLCAPNACLVQAALGIRRDSFVLNLDTVCNSFQTQLELATALIRAGQAKKVLLFQSSSLTVLAPFEAPFAPLFGDGATAQVIGAVSDGRGVLASAHICDASLYGGLPGGIPGKRWYEDGRTVIYLADRVKSRQMLHAVTDQATEVIGRALAEAKLERNDVDFLATHQASAWFREVVQTHVGLPRARSVDTFTTAASLSAANIPFVLATADREGMLKDDGIVVTFGGGGGVTVGSFVLRWGR